jgi:hypothetical protein
MQDAIKEFDRESSARLLRLDATNKVAKPLYHYTDGAGLKGIIENKEIWFTSHLHLNDPGEIRFGVKVAAKLLEEIGSGSDPRIKLLCDMIIDLFTHENMNGAFGFYIASFSQNGDELGQWRGYGDNGRGYAIGLAPHLFHPTDAIKPDPSQNYVVLPVVYGEKAGRQVQMPAIKKALQVAEKIIIDEAEAMRDPTVGMPFFDALAKSLIGSELLLNCLLTKHEAYKNEEEIRLVITGEHKKLSSALSHRTRGSEIVPFIKSEFPLHNGNNVTEIVVGPSAVDTAENGVARLLGENASGRIRRSSIPYRAS